MVGRGVSLGARRIFVGVYGSQELNLLRKGQSIFTGLLIATIRRKVLKGGLKRPNVRLKHLAGCADDPPPPQ